MIVMKLKRRDMHFVNIRMTDIQRQNTTDSTIHVSCSQVAEIIIIGIR